MNGFANKNGMNGVFSKATGEKHDRPLTHAYFALGEGKGIKAAIWPSSVTLQRTEKKDGQWQTTQEITLAYNVVKEIAWRSSHWLQKMDDVKEREKLKE
ncbi:MAG TPA: hypothetical protein VJJ76_03690 [archaeon]|nr:hypothetical protein [archaeon]